MNNPVIRLIFLERICGIHIIYGLTFGLTSLCGTICLIFIIEYATVSRIYTRNK